MNDHLTRIENAVGILKLRQHPGTVFLPQYTDAQLVKMILLEAAALLEAVTP